MPLVNSRNVLAAVIALHAFAVRAQPGQDGGAPAAAAVSLNSGATPGSGTAPILVPAVIALLPAPSSVTATIGQTVVTIPSSAFRNTSALTAADLLLSAPGVTTIGGSGPRDTSISVRGSNDRQVGGIRNVVLLDDGFPVTQPDGMGRADLVDPHAYGSVHVVEGPSSTLFGNYAVDGAIDFVTRSATSIDGAELGAEFGSFDTFDDWLDVGGRLGAVEGTIFGSNVRGSGFIANSRYDTSTENALASYDVTPSDRVTLKVINNVTDTQLPVRLSLDQYGQNPYQRNCLGLQSPGCSSVRLFVNGRNGPAVPVSPQEAGTGRFDRRTVAGTSWTHSFDASTSLRVQALFDERDIDQPNSATSNIADDPSLNGIVELTHKGALFGLPATTLLGGNANGQRVRSLLYNLTPAAIRSIGALTQAIDGTEWNAGGRLQERVQLAPRLAGVVGLGGEISAINARASNFTYPLSGRTMAQGVRAGRAYGNIAPEASLLYAVRDDTALHLRVGTGYASPNYSQLFISPAGVPGDNTALRSQRNVGVDLGVAYSSGADLTLSATGFYEFFDNEFVTQSPGAGLQNYTSNAPASQHRGVEIGLEWSPLPRTIPGLRLTADELFDDQVYTDYEERLSAAHATATFDRAGRRIPGVVPDNIDARLLYDRPAGGLAGLGGFLEVVSRGAYPIDNANQVSVPRSTLVNLELHYDPPRGLGALSRATLFVEVLNLFGQVSVGSSADISDTINGAGAQNGAASLAATGTGSIFAGTPRAVYGGIRMRL